MTRLQKFQQATVDAAVHILASKNGPRRFLIADEVGLGKTIVARAIAEQLKPTGKIFNVFYLCPSLEIAAQNRDKFGSLTKLPREAQLLGTDRLSLALNNPPTAGNGFRIFSLTPETSLPSWKPGSRTGRKAERELIFRLIRHSYPKLAHELHKYDVARGKQLLFERSHGDVEHLATAFREGLQAVFEWRHSSLETRMGEWLDHNKDLLEFISRCRSALAFASLSRTRASPDLLILDEFHRYADLVVSRREGDAKKETPREKERRQERERIHSALMVKLLKGATERPPAILLLSATPYQLNRLDGSEINAGKRYSALIDLVRFLHGSEGDTKANEVRSLINTYHRSLSDHGDRDVVIERIRSAKSRLENALSSVIARTERALALSEDLFVRQPEPVNVSQADIENFRHLAHAISSDKPSLSVWTTPLWTSVPYPAQTLHGYAVWDSIKRAGRPKVTIDNARKEPAHPQLRALQEKVIKSALLEVPWLPPSLPWWELEGPWAQEEAQSGKTLIFSRYKATPTALSALLSMPIDEIAHGRATARSEKNKIQSYLRPRAKQNQSLVAMFMPWPTLSTVIDPRKDRSLSLSAIRRDAERQLRQWLEEAGIEIQKGPIRPSWKLVYLLESGGDPERGKILSRILKRAGLKDNAISWPKPEKLQRISDLEIQRLALFLLSAPGVVVARSMTRHGVGLADENTSGRIFSFCWLNLRPYLGQKYFRRIVLGRSRNKQYPSSLMSAILKGGFESALDEQITLINTLGDKIGPDVVDEIAASLLIRPGLVRIRRAGRDSTVRVHAAVPFVGGERRGGRSDNRREKLRSDAVRRAFNSPFWPHVLSTTSVGQEGLDFHYWADKVVHWDLPLGPVEFEQREGRISRYSSITVRRSFVEKHAVDAYAAEKGISPFNKLFNAAHNAEDDSIGLAKWWTPTTFKPTRVTFNWNFSVRQERLRRLETDLLYYRLGLGQPDSKAFVEMLGNIRASDEEARSLALNLSPSKPMPASTS